MAEQSTRARDISVFLKHKPEEIHIKRVYFTGIYSDQLPEPRTGRKHLHWVITLLCEHHPNSPTLINRLPHTSQSSTRGTLFREYFGDTAPGSNHAHTHTQAHNSAPPQDSRSSRSSISHIPREGTPISTNSASNRGPTTSPVTLPPILTNSPPTQVHAPIPAVSASLATNSRSSSAMPKFYFVRLAVTIHPDDMGQFHRAKDSVPMRLV